MKFEQRVNKWLKKVNLQVDQFTRLVALQMHDRIVERTPVDTGRLRASWNIIAGEQADLSVADKDFAGGFEAGTSVALAKQAGLKLAKVYTISNNLPYAEAIENGHSQRQAPNGMVRMAIADVRTTLEVELG